MYRSAMKIVTIETDFRPQDDQVVMDTAATAVGHVVAVEPYQDHWLVSCEVRDDASPPYQLLEFLTIPR